MKRGNREASSSNISSGLHLSHINGSTHIFQRYPIWWNLFGVTPGLVVWKVSDRLPAGVAASSCVKLLHKPRRQLSCYPGNIALKNIIVVVGTPKLGKNWDCIIYYLVLFYGSLMLCWRTSFPYLVLQRTSRNTPCYRMLIWRVLFVGYKWLLIINARSKADE